MIVVALCALFLARLIRMWRRSEQLLRMESDYDSILVERTSSLSLLE
jgi:hypothetical protein